MLDEKKALYDTQKVAVIKVLKENYMITGKITDLPEEEQKVFA